MENGCRIINSNYKGEIILPVRNLNVRKSHEDIWDGSVVLKEAEMLGQFFLIPEIRFEVQELEGEENLTVSEDVWDER